MTLPADVRPYRRTDVFTEAAVPGGLPKAHTTKEGAWALIHVLEGRLAYRTEDPRRLVSEAVLTPETPPGAAILAGGRPPPSNLHALHIGVEMLKLLWLPGFGLGDLRQRSRVWRRVGPGKDDERTLDASLHDAAVQRDLRRLGHDRRA